MTSLNRLPMRGSGVFTDGIEHARQLLSERPGGAAAPSSRAGGRPTAAGADYKGGHEGSDSASRDEWSLDLNGRWDFVLLGSPEEVQEQVLSGPVSPDLGWSKISVPGAWTLQGPEVSGDGNRAFEPPRYTNVIMPFGEDPPGFPKANPTGVYRRRISVPRHWKGRRVILRVGAAESVVQVFVNGELVGGGTDSRLPSEFDLGAVVRPGRRAELAIVVTKWSAQTWLEDQDQWWHGGIQRSVSLHSVPESSFAQVKLIPDLESGIGTLDLEARLAGPVVRERGWTVELWVETRSKPGRKSRTLATTGQIDVPVWDDADEVSSLLSGMFIEPGVVRAHLQVPEPEVWSHENPALYRTMLVLRDPESRVIQVHGALSGFRSVEIGGNELLINGQPVLLHGVNIHEHSPDTGRAVTAEQTRADLVMMKAHNLNAVRAAHYPHDEHLAELCDELGLYLIDEANIESHSRQASLCHDSRFANSIIERVRRMVERDQHHPSIIIWSLGNESGYGAAHDSAAAFLRRYDPSRPIQYEGPFMHDLYAAAPVSDVVCPMYSSIEDITAWADSGRDDRRPLILCEYSHAMGNSNGSLSDYWDAFESTPGLQGGFIWEWVDHGLKLFDGYGDGYARSGGPDRSDGSGLQLRGPLGGPSWGYGGDFGDHPNDSNFVCDGLVSADRVAGPAMAEVHHVGRPITVTMTNPIGQPRSALRVRNRRWFVDTSDLRARWELTIDGDAMASGELEVPPIGARSEVVVALPFRRSTLAKAHPGAEVHLTVTFVLRRSSDWAGAGHVVAVEQMVVPPSAAPAAPAALRRDGQERREGQERRLVDPVRPSRSFDINAIGWRPTVFRALTDNAGLRQGWMRGLVGNLGRWVDEQGLDRAEWTPGRQRVRTLDAARGDVTEITQSGQLTVGSGAVVKVRRVVWQMSDGWTRVDAEVRIPRELVDVPRVGFELALEGGSPWSNVEWFGDGPHECYPDRRAAGRVGRWRTTVDQMYVDHAVPQEHGHRTGLRWVALTRAGAGRRREGILIVAEQPSGADRPGFSVRHHSDDELWGALHSHDLTVPARGVPSSARRIDGDPTRTYLYLDIAQRGIGTASCGPDTLERYRIPAGRHNLRVWVCGFDPRSEDPGVLARTLR
ncbi:MAG: glycoside hydrolase family 2 TIM barrel-domain containing protein [Microthrixaceae bacterium]